MLFDISFLYQYRQKQTEKNTDRENSAHGDWDYQPGHKVLLCKDGIFRKTESRYESDPWTIMSVHTNGTIRVKRETKSEQLKFGE